MPIYVKLIVILLSCISTALIYENFLSNNFEKKIKGNYFIYFSICVITNFFVNLIGNTYLNYVWSFAYVIFISTVLYNGKNKKPIVSMLIILILFSVEETVVCYALEWYFDSFNIPYDNFYYIAVFSSNIVLILLYKPISFLISKKAMYTNFEKNLIEVFLLILSLISIVSISLFMGTDIPEYLLIVLVFICIVIVCFDIYLVFILDRIHLNQKLEEELKLSRLQQKINQDFYQSKLEQYNEQAKLFHDIKHHLYALKTLYENNEVEKAKQYNSDLVEKMSYKSVSINNKVIRILINDLIDKCENHNIKIEYDIDSRIEYENILDIDLVSIYSNLFTNALEAASKCPTPFIKLKMRIHNEMVVTIISNNYVGEINIKRNKIISSKKDHVGFGLNNIHETIKRNNGIYDISYKDNVFTYELILPLCNKETSDE